MQALERHARARPVAAEHATPFGTLVVVEGELATPDGRDPKVRAVWERRTGLDQHRLVTAYPA